MFAVRFDGNLEKFCKTAEPEPRLRRFAPYLCIPAFCLPCSSPHRARTPPPLTSPNPKPQPPSPPRTAAPGGDPRRRRRPQRPGHAAEEPGKRLSLPSPYWGREKLAEEANQVRGGQDEDHDQGRRVEEHGG